MVIYPVGKSDEEGARSRSLQPQPLQSQVTTEAAVASASEQGVTSYLVASSPEVLNQILRDNESRGLEFNPALYTHPANALNTTKVEFAPPTGYPPPSPSTRVHGPPPPAGTPRSLPGSGHSTLSRGGSFGSLEKGQRAGSVRRKPSLAASLTSSSQVPQHDQHASSASLAACRLQLHIYLSTILNILIVSKCAFFLPSHSFIL